MSDWSTKQRIFIYLLFLISLAVSISQMKNTYLYGSLYDLNFFLFVQELEKAFVKIRPKNNSKKPVQKVA